MRQPSRLNPQLTGWILVLLLCSTSPGPAATSDQIKEVAGNLVCLCGDCNRESLATCLCAFSSDDRDRIGDALDAGQQQQQIIQQFVDDFGPVVLATPPAEGSNLLAWIAPITLFVLGILLVRSVLLSWRRSHREEAESGTRVASETDQQKSSYEEKLRRELDQYDTF